MANGFQSLFAKKGQQDVFSKDLETPQAYKLYAKIENFLTFWVFNRRC